MANQEFDAITQLASSDADARFRTVAQANARSQIRSRFVRRTLRWSILILGLLGYLFIHFTYYGLGTLCWLLVVMAATVLFFMGGIAPARVRRLMSNRERRILDD